MTPCSANIITPTMIRKGQVQIGDQITLEENPASPAGENPSEAVSVAAEVSVSRSDFEDNSAAASSEAMSARTAAREIDTAGKAAPVPVPAPDDAADAVSVSAVMPGNQPAQAQERSSAPQPSSPSYINPNAAFQSNTAALPLIYQNMTDYVSSLGGSEQQAPSFSVPSNPLVPPEYEQTIDYDTAQYMNGFLRTQIGRSMRVEQLIGSNSTEDRYGFLVGVGNNYLLMQDIYNGNISLIDLYSVKYVYIYYSEPVFPNLPFAASSQR